MTKNMEKYGFVYIWRDKKRKMFYIGCHWGNINDRYICSSDRMGQVYKRRPEDFKRKILETNILDKSLLLEREYHWLQQIKEEELSIKYYNANKHHFGHWMTFKDNSGKNHHMYGKTHSEEAKRKISESGKGRTPWNKGKTDIYSEETLKKMGEKHIGNNYNSGKKHSEESKKKMSDALLGNKPWNKGKTDIYSEESLRKMSENSKGQIAWNKGKTGIYSEETLKKMRGRTKGKSWKIDQESGKRVWVEKEIL